MSITENGQDQTDYLPGDPARHVTGPPEEQSARVHAPLEPKPRIINTETIQHDVEMRIAELRPQVEELKKLQTELEALEAWLPQLQEITGRKPEPPADKPRRGRPPKSS